MTVTILAMLFFACAFVPVYAEGEETAVQEQTAGTSDAVEAIEVTSYDFEATVSKDHSYAVTEKITVNLPDDTDKIEFSIPNGNFRVTDIMVEEAAYTADKGSASSKIVITDADKLTKGEHTYTVSYTIREFMDRDETKDIFYFDVLLPEWQQPIGTVNISVSFPDDFPWDDMHYYAGQLGVEDVSNKLTYKASESKKTVTITGDKIPENFGITLTAELPEGYWEGALDGSVAVGEIIVTLAVMLLALLLMWIIGGRDPKVTKNPQTTPIEGITPVELGYIYDGKVRPADIISLIIYFATKGYLKISEYEPKRYMLIRKNEPKNEEKMMRNAYNALFEDVYRERGIDTEDIGPRLLRIMNNIREDIAAGYTGSDMIGFTPLSKAFRIIGTVLFGAVMGMVNVFSYQYQYLQPNYGESFIIGVLSALLVFLLCGAVDTMYFSSSKSAAKLPFAAGAGLGIIVLYLAVAVFRRTGQLAASAAVIMAAAAGAFLVVIMRARGKGNTELIVKLQQLRHFIYHPTPKELLENHLADKNYYYDMMPYAIMFGASDAWAISFLTLDVEEPDWYSDDIEGHAFSNLRGEMTTVEYANDISAFCRTMENALNDWIRKHRR